MSAYNYHNNLLAMAYDVVFGPHIKMRPEALIFGYNQLLKNWTVMDRLGEIQVPTLVLAGRQDFLFPTEHQAILADRLPNAHLEMIECAGHNPHMERPAEVIEIIKSFLAEHIPVYA
jgi:pimeloyl-ACP methyl ester carboxylesterase